MQLLAARKKLAEVDVDTFNAGAGNINTATEKFSFSREKKKSGNLWEKMRTDLVDRLAPVERLEKNIKGNLQSAESSAYKQARLYSGTPEYSNRIIQKELKPIIRNIENKGYDYQDLAKYAEAVHAKDVNVAGMKSGLTNAEINDIIKKLGNADMENARKELVAYSRRRLGELVDSGFIKEETYDLLNAKWENYIPLQRVFDDDKVEFTEGYE